MTDRFDVVVVGAGIAGAAAAWRLAADVRVALVEMEPQPGMHATGRSAALLNETIGDAVLCRLGGESRPFLTAPPAGFAEHPLVAPRGLLWVGRAGRRAQLEDLVAKAPHAARHIDLEAARELVPTLHPAAAAGGAVHEPAAMTIDVAALLAGYVAGLRRRGGVVRTSSEAIVLRRGPAGWFVRAGVHELRGDVVVDAAGAWADVVAARAGIAPLGLRTVRRTAALATTSAAVAGWPMVMDVDGRWYAEPEPGGLLVSPGDETPHEPADVRPDELDVALALERVGEALGVELRSVRRAWAGLRTFCVDRAPVAGPDPDQPSFVWLAGQGGGGIKSAPALAEIVATAIVDGRRVPDDVSPARLR